jgi:hypothetical protein
MLDSGADANEREGIRALVERAELRSELESLRDVYSDRLHRRSADFNATLGLRLAIAKLQRIPPGPSSVTSSS